MQIFICSTREIPCVPFFKSVWVRTSWNTSKFKCSSSQFGDHNHQPIQRRLELPGSFAQLWPCRDRSRLETSHVWWPFNMGVLGERFALVFKLSHILPLLTLVNDRQKDYTYIEWSFNWKMAHPVDEFLPPGHVIHGHRTTRMSVLRGPGGPGSSFNVQYWRRKLLQLVWFLQMQRAKLIW